jgi:hypothetical protein
MRRLLLSALALAIASPAFARPPAAAAPPAVPTATTHHGAAPASIVATLSIEVLVPTRRVTLASQGLDLAGAHVRQLDGTHEIAATRAFVRPGRGTVTLFFAHRIPAGRYTLATRYRVVDAQAAAPGCLPSSSPADVPRVRCVGPAVEFARQPEAKLPGLAPSSG